MFELRLVRHALALARFRNYARAAEALHLTQPSLSRSIAALERELGVRLFDRSKNGVRPTAYGELLLRRGASLIEGEVDLRREIRELAGLDAGAVRVGSGPYPAEVSVGRAAGRLLRAHPGIAVDVTCAEPDEVIRGVTARDIDVGICTLPASAATPHVRFEPLPQHPIVFACRAGHPLAARPRVSIDDIVQYPLATAMLGGPNLELAIRGRRSGRLDKERRLFAPAAHVNVMTLAKEIVRESDAIAPVTPAMIAAEEADGTLVRLELRDPSLTTRYGIATLADATLAPATIAFLDALRAIEAEVAADEARAAARRKHARRTADAVPEAAGD